MEATELGPFESIEDVMIDADGNPMGYGRPTDCMHLSTILKRIRQVRGDVTGNPPGWQEGAAMYFGFLWENAVEQAFKAIGLERAGVESQIRLRYEGICGTLDGVDWSGETPVLQEYKATWKTMRKVQEGGLTTGQSLSKNFPDWELQLSGYLYMLSKKVGYWVREAVLYVFFVRSDYAKDLPAGPRVRVFSIVFDVDELEANWRLFQGVKEEIEREVRL